MVVLATAARAGSIIGDEFTVTLFEKGAQVGQVTAVASVGTPIAVPGGEITWIDQDTFQLSFFRQGPQVDLTYVLAGLDFTEGGAPADIAGLNWVQAEFHWPYELAFDGHAITLVWPLLDERQAGDGELIRFDVATGPPAPPGTCEAGQRAGEPCFRDADCTGRCAADPGTTCRTDVDCGGTCGISGSACRKTSDCRTTTCSEDSGLVCGEDADCPGACEADGRSCLGDFDCSDRVTGTCNPLTETCEGAGDATGSPCFGSGTCIGTAAGVCETIFASCQPGREPCLANDFCELARCVPLEAGICDAGPSQNQVCYRDSDCAGVCSNTGAACQDETDCLSGICSLGLGRCQEDIDCAVKVCADDFVTPCSSDGDCLGVCTGHGGGPCRGNFDCEDFVQGVCSSTTGLCEQAGSANGNTCGDSSECFGSLFGVCQEAAGACFEQSDSCEPDSGVCERGAQCVPEPAGGAFGAVAALAALGARVRERR